jgi:hypothetical protein
MDDVEAGIDTSWTRDYPIQTRFTTLNLEETMRLNLDLEKLEVETTVMQPEFAEPTGMEAADGGYAASILYNTQTRPIERPNTNSTPCYA